MFHNPFFNISISNTDSLNKTIPLLFKLTRIRVIIQQNSKKAFQIAYNNKINGVSSALEPFYKILVRVQIVTLMRAGGGGG
jgi:hypothetical protein